MIWSIVMVREVLHVMCYTLKYTEVEVLFLFLVCLFVCLFVCLIVS